MTPKACQLWKSTAGMADVVVLDDIGEVVPDIGVVVDAIGGVVDGRVLCQMTKPPTRTDVTARAAASTIQRFDRRAAEAGRGPGGGSMGGWAGGGGGHTDPVEAFLT